jgi:hypothetical protein
VQTKKRKMKMGEAFVGMKRSGSQLCYLLALERRSLTEDTTTYLRKQNILCVFRACETPWSSFQLLLSSKKERKGSGLKQLTQTHPQRQDLIQVAP